MVRRVKTKYFEGANLFEKKFKMGVMKGIKAVPISTDFTSLFTEAGQKRRIVLDITITSQSTNHVSAIQQPIRES